MTDSPYAKATRNITAIIGALALFIAVFTLSHCIQEAGALIEAKADILPDVPQPFVGSKIHLTWIDDEGVTLSDTVLADQRWTDEARESGAVTILPATASRDGRTRLMTKQDIWSDISLALIIGGFLIGILMLFRAYTLDANLRPAPIRKTSAATGRPAR